MPEKTLKKLNERLLPEWKICFFSALLVGLLAHLYKITSWLPNWDSLVFRYDAQNMVVIGRWFLPVACSLSSFYDLPFLNGLIAIVFHALSAVMICRILPVQQKTTAALIGAVVVSFPTVTSIMMYNYVADGYSIAFFFSVLAARLLTKENPRYLLASLLIALSAGIYQAYITVTILLLLLHLLDGLLFDKQPSPGRWFKKVGCLLLSGAAGIALYAVVLKITLALFSVELLDYQGINATTSLSNIDLLSSFYVVKETFVNSFFDLSNGVNVYIVLNAIILIASLVYYLICIVKNRIYKRPVVLALIVLLTACLVIGAAILAFVNPLVDYHNLMRMGYVSFYLLFLMIYERNVETTEKQLAFKRWAVLLTALVLIGNQVVIANVSYHKAQMAYEKSYGVLIRIADRIEQTPESQTCQKIAVLGALDGSESYSVNLTPDITGITDGYILRADDETVKQSVFCSAINDYCGKNYRFVSGEEKETLARMESVQAMQAWPSNGCVAVVDGTIVIKFGSEGDK